MTEGTTRASDFIRSNIFGLIAIFIALSGTAIALPGKNKVDSGDIKNAQVKGKDIAADAVDSTKVADNSLTGADIDESSLSINAGGGGAPTGPAGGDLSGTYPNPSIAPGAVGSGEIADDALTGDDIDESSLALSGLPSVPTGPAGGDLTGSYPNPTLATGAVDGLEIEDDSVTADDIDEFGLNAANADTVNGHDVRSLADDGVAMSGMSFSLSCLPSDTRTSLTSSVDNSKAYIEFSDGTTLFDDDLDNGEAAVAITTADMGLVNVLFLNGQTGRVVSLELAWRTDYEGCVENNFDVEAFGRAIG